MSDNGPSLVCPGCGSPDVDVRTGLICGECAPAADLVRRVSPFKVAQRLQKAEAKLAEIRAEVAHIPGDGINFTLGEQNRAEDILAIIGTEEESRG